MNILPEGFTRDTHVIEQNRRELHVFTEEEKTYLSELNAKSKLHVFDKEEFIDLENKWACVFHEKFYIYTLFLNKAFELINIAKNFDKLVSPLIKQLLDINKDLPEAFQFQMDYCNLFNRYKKVDSLIRKLVSDFFEKEFNSNASEPESLAGGERLKKLAYGTVDNTVVNQLVLHDSIIEFLNNDENMPKDIYRMTFVLNNDNNSFKYTFYFILLYFKLFKIDVTKIKNFFQDDNIYKGINSQFKFNTENNTNELKDEILSLSPTGNLNENFIACLKYVIRMNTENNFNVYNITQEPNIGILKYNFEIQFQTQRTKKIKDKAHEIYEKDRNVIKCNDIKQHLQKEMQTLYNDVVNINIDINLDDMLGDLFGKALNGVIIQKSIQYVCISDVWKDTNGGRKKTKTKKRKTKRKKRRTKRKKRRTKRKKRRTKSKSLHY